MIDALLGQLRREALDEAADPDAYWALVTQLWALDATTVWAAVQPLAADADPRLQALAVDVVSGLGFEAQPLFFETLRLFEALLARGPAAEVVRSIAEACARFFDPAVVSMLAPLATHADAEVREAVVHALRRYDKPAAIEALSLLSADAVEAVREGATAALGSQRPLVDTPEVRAALAARLTDAHEPTRDEAIVGLGLRGDRRALGPLRTQLERGLVSVPFLEAAEALASPVLAPALRALADLHAREATLTDAEAAAVSAALLACVPRMPA